MHHIFQLYLLIGLPKAAIIAQSRLFKGGCLMRLGDFDENDIVYTPLPLYHSAAGVIGLCGIIEAGIFLLYITSPLLFQVRKCNFIATTDRILMVLITLFKTIICVKGIRKLSDMKSSCCMPRRRSLLHFPNTMNLYTCFPTHTGPSIGNGSRYNERGMGNHIHLKIVV